MPLTMDESKFNIVDLDNVETYVKMLVYGHPGAGKTYLCATAPDPLIIITEGDVSKVTLKKAKKDLGNKIQVVEIKSLDEFEELYNWLEGGGYENYKTICLDGLTEFQKLAAREIIQNNIERAKKIKKVTDVALIRYSEDVLEEGEWNILTNLTNRIISYLRNLPIDVVMTALVTSIKGEIMDGPYVQPAKLAKSISAQFNTVCYLGTKITDDPKNPRVRVLVTDGTQDFIAKNPGGVLPVVIENPNLTEIFEIVRKGLEE